MSGSEVCGETGNEREQEEDKTRIEPGKVVYKERQTKKEIG